VTPVIKFDIEETRLKILVVTWILRKLDNVFVIYSMETRNGVPPGTTEGIHRQIHI
jgi:hypothetical protein